MTEKLFPLPILLLIVAALNVTWAPETMVV